MSAQALDRRRFIGLAAGAALAGTVASQWAPAEPASAKQVPTTREHHRAVVVGTGFGGAIAAYNLGRMGVETLVLERGRRWDVNKDQDTFPRFLHPDHRVAWRSKRPVFPCSPPAYFRKYAGLVERVEGKRMDVLCGAGVGGSSLIFAGMMLKPSEELFYKVFPDEIRYREMDSTYFPRVEQMLGISRIPDDVFEHKRYSSSQKFLKYALEAGLPADKLGNVVDWSVIRQELNGELDSAASVGNYLFGVNSGARNSVDRNYLRQAEANEHVTVAPLHIVTRIMMHKNRYVVYCDRIDEHTRLLERKIITCDALFLGAGSMGTSQLLVRARATGDLPQLDNSIGTGWGNNGNRNYSLMGVHGNTRAHQGGPPCVAITDWEDTDNPIAIEHGGAPVPVNAHIMSVIAVGGIPDKRGQFLYDPKHDKVTLHWPKHADDSAEQAGLRTIRRLHDVAGGRKINHTPDGNIAYHPLGGAVMGQSCDTYGRVHGYQGLYVVDGALVPGSTPGCNPSWTISALAERCLDDILQKDLGQVF
ncbi:MAG: GMC family oxidoreductase [Longispora sp.]|nr:GMC family oxidoreductase [Longispora sp. (in: high G+C Gram-positive bacteria)]